MITLRKITEDNFIECINLEVKEDQRKFAAHNMFSLAEAYVDLTNGYCIPMPMPYMKMRQWLGLSCLHIMRLMKMTTMMKLFTRYAG